MAKRIMLLADLDASPGHLIRRCHQIAMNVFAREIAGDDLTPVQFAALTAIRTYPCVDATRLSELVAFDRSTVGDVLERLESKGLVERTSGERDKRTKPLVLTGCGRDVLDRVEAGVVRAQQRLLSGLTDVERIVFLSLLRKLIANHAGDEAAFARGSVQRTGTAGRHGRRRTRADRSVYGQNHGDGPAASTT